MVSAGAGGGPAGAAREPAGVAGAPCGAIGAAGCWTGCGTPPGAMKPFIGGGESTGDPAIPPVAAKMAEGDPPTCVAGSPTMLVWRAAGGQP